MAITKNCFQIDAADNVAVVLDDVTATESVTVIGPSTGSVIAQNSVTSGHKIALSDIPQGAPVLKYGIRIGHAKTAISKGEWVHLHNCASDFDDRSSNFDPHTGAAADTKYE